MLTAAKRQFKISMLSTKYALMRAMVNKATFVMSIVFMILNNATFIIQYLILFSLKEDVGGYTFNQVLMLWALASGTFGVAHFFFKKAFNLSETITNGKLDAYIVQPKNILLQAITSDIDSSAIGDLLYGFILIFVSGISIKKFILFTIFVILGGLIHVAFAVILASFSFWISRSDIIADTFNSMIIHINTYPEGIFGGITRVVLYTLIPVGFISYIPVQVLTSFNIMSFIYVLLFTAFIIGVAFFMFYKGLKKYSSSNLMISKI